MIKHVITSIPIIVEGDPFENKDVQHILTLIANNKGILVPRSVRLHIFDLDRIMSEASLGDDFYLSRVRDMVLHGYEKNEYAIIFVSNLDNVQNLDEPVRRDLMASCIMIEKFAL